MRKLRSLRTRPSARAAASRMSLQRTVETGHVRQNFSHGRSKSVVVEKKKTRKLGSPGAAAEAPAAVACSRRQGRSKGSGRRAAPKPAPSPSRNASKRCVRRKSTRATARSPKSRKQELLARRAGQAGAGACASGNAAPTAIPQPAAASNGRRARRVGPRPLRPLRLPRRLAKRRVRAIVRSRAIGSPPRSAVARGRSEGGRPQSYNPAMMPREGGRPKQIDIPSPRGPVAVGSVARAAEASGSANRSPHARADGCRRGRDAPHQARRQARPHSRSRRWSTKSASA